MNGLEKSIHELVNILVQYEATTHKSESAVLIGEASTSKANGKGARRRKRKKGKGTAVTTTAGKGKGKGKVGGSQRSKANDVCIHCHEKGHWKRSVHNSSPTQVLQRSRRLSKDEMILRLGNGKACCCGGRGISSLIYVCGPLSIPARGGFSSFITFIDDHSRYGYVYLMRYKSEAFGRFTGYSKETAGYYFYDPTVQKIFVSRSAVFLEKGFPSNSRHDEVLIVESSGEPHHDNTISFKPTVHTDGVPVLRRSTRESRVPERYGFVGLTSQLDNDPKTYGEATSDIDSDNWLEAMKSKIDSMGSNQVWTP
ncbi:UNVERIFIED_CONTAM: hypothetical protein Sradi_3314100 [Sesamum radiatum]|uniref:Retroviral polymerase SH3-like domain-containing protein n=1 Tax=Sesamum radiatum TaxID=300843 RepID=A0AAW2R2A6_SESRA